VELKAAKESAYLELRSLRQSLETDKAAAVERLQAEREEVEEGMRRDMKAALLEAETHAARQAASGESAAREKVLKERQEVEEALWAEARAAAEAAATELRTVRRGAEEAAAAARQSELAAQMQHAAAARTLTLALALWS
jgi:hypothetical protein